MSPDSTTDAREAGWPRRTNGCSCAWASTSTTARSSRCTHSRRTFTAARASGRPRRERAPEAVVGRFADLESQLAELHQDLRDLAHSLEPRSLLQQPLPDAVERELAALSRRTGISTSVELEGSFDALTASQRIALLRVLQEALSNIRYHSGSREVAVLLREGLQGRLHGDP